ncbi:type IIL restriction-modification enzyme MmeI [Rothia sp. P5764]|uniref:type IIL restriction-modification enzyme MmeI n=1 Tax=Rothia sp. P5764 TaxID=3402654 RepID=UPI003AD04D05
MAETHADLKATERMGELFDDLLSANPGVLQGRTKRHSLDVFFSRLLFCYFAEDTGVFEPNRFTNAVGSHTLEDGSDTQDFLTDLFSALDTEWPEDKPAHLAGFPYMNGRLFSRDQTLTVPVFTRKSRSLLIGLGTLLWQEINPDIFGSMFQAIVTPGQRSDLGQHYISVPNILKTLEPLFLDDLRAQFDAAYDKPKKLDALLERVGRIRVFDISLPQPIPVQSSPTRSMRPGFRLLPGQNRCVLTA